MDVRVPRTLYNLFSKLTKVYVIVAIFVYFIDKKGAAEGRKSLGSKKKVVIVGEMADMYDFLANSSNESVDEAEEVSENVDNDNMVNQWQRGRYQKRRGQTSQKGVFVPVAAYSVTHSRVPMANRHENIHRMKQFHDRSIVMHPSASSPGKTTESAVFGYLNRPEIVEFRGQYFYGPNPVSTRGTLQSAASNSEPPTILSPAPNFPVSTTRPRGGMGAGSLLLATLPLVLAPMLSYLFTPMIIPVTATIAAGKRKRRHITKPANLTTSRALLSFTPTSEEPNVIPLVDIVKKVSENKGQNYSGDEDTKSKSARAQQLKEMKVIADFLRKVHFSELDRDKAMANFLLCDGLLSQNDHCLERLSCEFSDPINYSAPVLERSVASIILTRILENPFINKKVKRNMRLAALHGKENSQKCAKYSCSRRKLSPSIVDAN